MDYQEIELVLGNARCKLMLDDGAEKPSSSPPHVHTNFELFYVWKGEVEIRTETQNYKIREKQAVLIAPACYHHSFTSPGSEQFSVYFSFVRTGKHIDCEDICSRLESVFSGVSVTVVGKAEELGARMDALRRQHTQEMFCKRERLQAELTGLLLALYDILSEQTQPHPDAVAKKKVGMQYRYEIDALLAKNYARDIDLSFLARALYLSPKRVAVLIQSLYGKSFRQVKVEMKLQVAKQMLTETDLTVAQIAEKIGYRSTRGFLSAFVQMTGMTPSKYRDRRR